MNENVRELVIDAPAQQSRPATKQSLREAHGGAKRTVGESSDMSQTTKGFMGNTPVQLAYNQVTPKQAKHHSGPQIIN